MKQNFKDILLATLNRHGKMALSTSELIGKSHIKKKLRHVVSRQLDELVRDGLVIEERGRYTLTKNAGLVPGEIVRVHSTYGFARLEDGAELFVPGRYLMGAMPGDKVLLRRTAGERELDEGRVFVVTEESDTLLSGVVSFGDDGVFLLPDGAARYPMLLSGLGGIHVQDGDKVVARITRRGTRHSEHRAQIVQVFGSADTAENCAEAIIAAAEIDRVFTDELINEAARLCDAGISRDDVDGREDLRGEPIFTIDGADTKDIDDAISLVKTDTGYRLGVHIADVSHYVRYGDAFDREAYERGTSVYYVDKVIPMLPPGLSNGICSLNPGEDRLAFSVLIDIDQDGKMISYRFFKSVIRSCVKGVYNEINALMSGEANEAIVEKYAPLIEQFRLMMELAAILRTRRLERGALELDSSECKFIMGDDGTAKDIIPAERGMSEELIESFMLMANAAAAAFAEQHEIPFIFRVHESPPATKIMELSALLGLLGIDAAGIEPGVSPGALSRVLAASKDTPYRRLVNGSLLRSMAKAVYREENIGHFGLVMKQYSHFTSPIRRYPDLYIHRIMSQMLSGEAGAEKIRRRYANAVNEIAVHSSATEQRAVSAERACVDVYKAEYMRRFIGQEFEGVIVSATFMGLYVALPNTVEGLLRGEHLPGGDWEFDGRMAYANRQTGKVYRVGDSVRVVVASVSISAGNVDFSIQS